MSFKIFSFVVFIALLFSGCGSKSYYQPKDVAGKISFDDKLPSRIKSVNSHAATLNNGQFISKKGLSSWKLDKDSEMLFSDEKISVSTNGDGILNIHSNDGKVIQNIKFDSQIATATIKDSQVALLFVDNTISLFSLETSSTLFKQKNDDAVAVTTKIASPYFLNELVIFPTLDGKLVIVDTKEKKVVKDMVVSSEKYFNNVIFFEIIDEKLVAATSTKVISINPKFINTLDADVVDVIYIKDAVYIFTKDGKIILTDANLKLKKEKKFPFARFVGAIYGKYIYAIEKEGYLIATDANLVSSNIFQFSAPFYGLSSSLDSFLFTTDDTIFFDDKFFKLAK